MIILVLRLLAGACLLLFMGSVGYFLQRDYRLALQHMETRAAVRGWVRVLANEGIQPPVGGRLPLAPATTLGRAATNTIPIDDGYASNEHALLVWRGGQWWLEDLNSSNGTLLNDTPLEEPTVLSAGDVITVGNVQLRLELE